MFEIKGKYASATVYTDLIEEEAVGQILNLCNQPVAEGATIKIMPDVHAGKGCTIGTTMTIKDKVVPNLVGVDIGCGMLVACLGKVPFNFSSLDKIIRQEIPSGFDIREEEHFYMDEIDLTKLCCYEHINAERAALSLGTLGGGNHFIEVDCADNGDMYLVIHSGSRHLGVEVASYYQEEAYRRLSRKFNKEAQTELIARLKAEGRVQDIQSELKKLTAYSVPKEFAYCEGELFDQYIHDMRIVQKYAALNRKAMLSEICKHTWKSNYTFTTIHNYIDTENMILRKGAVSAQAGEKLIIPINMRDGSLICTGKGNPDWNCSAPHGAGRLMSRSKAKQEITLEEFENSMQGIYTTSVNSSTLDESPMAYKSIEDILGNIGDTVEVNEIIKPVYNFKAS